MPFEIVRNDIVNMQADAIVNTASMTPVVGWGTDAAINMAAGQELIRAREAIGTIEMGDCAATPAYGLKAKYVIHAVSPTWRGGDKGEVELLRGCYRKALDMAGGLGCASIAFPLLSAGSRGFPGELALKTAVEVFGSFLEERDMHIYLVVFSREALCVSEKLVASVASYIDDKYTGRKLMSEYGLQESESDSAKQRQREIYRRRLSRLESLREEDDRPNTPADFAVMAAAPMPAKRAEQALKGESLEDRLRRADEGFSRTLMRLIDSSGMKDSQVYKKANVDRKLFSKIRGNPDYRPGKATVLAFALALELDLEGTKALLQRAGFALSHSSKFDIIVEYFILERNYDVFEINEVLFKFDQPLIGG